MQMSLAHDFSFSHFAFQRYMVVLQGFCNATVFCWSASFPAEAIRTFTTAPHPPSLQPRHRVLGYSTAIKSNDGFLTCFLMLLFPCSWLDGPAKSPDREAVMNHAGRVSRVLQNGELPTTHPEDKPGPPHHIFLSFIVQISLSSK